jgi:hypothetical protein
MWMKILMLRKHFDQLSSSGHTCDHGFANRLRDRGYCQAAALRQIAGDINQMKKGHPKILCPLGCGAVIHPTKVDFHIDNRCRNSPARIKASTSERHWWHEEEMPAPEQPPIAPPSAATLPPFSIERCRDCGKPAIPGEDRLLFL